MKGGDNKLANDKFFEDEKVEETPVEEPAKVKVGEKEYTPEELDVLVGLGNQAKELEVKWDTKLDRVMPEFSRSREELKKYREIEESRGKAEIEAKQTKGEELSEEERINLAKAEARKLGLMLKEDFDPEYHSRRQTEKVLSEIDSVISGAAADGKPKIDPQGLVQYMVDTGIKNPTDAYELKFKKELREIEMQKLQSIKPQGLYTESGSTAGAKAPSTVAVTKDNLRSLLDGVISRGGGQ